MRILPYLALLSTIAIVAAEKISGPDYIPPFSPEGKKFWGHPEPVGGIDFWKNDAMHLASSPTRNLMPNPSFEQGFRYWGWQQFGGRGYALSRSEKKSLLIQGKKTKNSLPLLSFPLPFERGKTYTVSCFAKSSRNGAVLTFCPISSSFLSPQFDWKSLQAKSSKFPLTTEWTRCSFTFTQAGVANCIHINGDAEADIQVDNIQVEEGKKVSEFAAPPVSGLLKTSSEKNVINKKDAINAVFEITGNTPGQVQLTLWNFFRERVWQGKYTFNGQSSLKLPFDTLGLGTGIFVLEAKYTLKNQNTFSDYYRFSILNFLHNKHPTSTLFGTITNFQNDRSDASAELMMHAGFGGTTYGSGILFEPETYRLREKYGIQNFLHLITGFSYIRKSKSVTQKEMKYLASIEKKSERITENDEKTIEDIVYRLVKEHSYIQRWAFSNETETRNPHIQAGRFNEWAKVQCAFYRGLKRANPKAIALPDSGTSCFMPHRGYAQMEGYLASTKDKVKWDAIAIHPYYALDGTHAGRSDLDQTTADLIALMKKYGYGKNTPIYYTELFNIPSMNMPEWKCELWGDPYRGSRPTYDFGLQEYNQAAWAARTYLVGLKYWPQLKHMNIWQGNLAADINLSPLAFVSAVNTLANLFPSPRFIADLRPGSGVRGYAFRQNEETIIAIWCTLSRVEKGMEYGPKMTFQAGKIPIELIDLMGNRRKLFLNNGQATIRLSPAPLFLKTKNSQELIAALQNGSLIGTDTSIRLNVYPTEAGPVKASFSNTSGKECHVKYQNKTLTVPARSTIERTISPGRKCIPGKLFDWSMNFDFQFDKQNLFRRNWRMKYFFVPYSPKEPDWKTIPAIAFENYYFYKKVSPDDISAEFQLAWNEKNLYLRLTAKDDVFLANPSFREIAERKYLWLLDGCLEVYFDTLFNARCSLNEGFDNDDYRYDFSYGNMQGATGPGYVNRLRAPGMQLAGGLNMPTKQEASKNIKCHFERTESGYVYTIVFPKRFLEPLQLRKGTCSGFGLFLHDIDKLEKTRNEKGLTLAVPPRAHCNSHPEYWPIMIFTK